MDATPKTAALIVVGALAVLAVLRKSFSDISVSVG